MKKKVFFTLIFLGLVSFSVFAFAAGEPAKIDVNLPGPYDTAKTGPVGFIANFYYFALGFGGLLAFGSMVYAGIKWTASQGNPGTISDAKDQIVQALWGLVLLGGAFVILNTINPELTVLQIPKLTEISSSSTAPGGESTSTCASVQPLTPIDQLGAQAAAMEGGQTVIWDSSDANASQNLAALQTEFGKLQNVALSNGYSVTANSVYRPLGYQTHFYEIKQRGMQLEALTGDAATACSDLKSAVDAERDKHRICVGVSYANCRVSSPSGCSPHVMGKGIDLSVSKGGSNADSIYAAFDALLQSGGVKLRWQQVAGDKYHFNLTNPPAGCASS